MIYIGIDPGKSGGIAMLNDTGQVVHVQKMPATERDVYEALHIEGGVDHVTGATTIVSPNRVPMRATLERVNPGVFVEGKSGRMGVVSAFTFGQGYGGLRMALVAAEIPFDEVAPAKWQQALGCRTKGDKNVSKRRAQELFPTLKITHAIADALLIAEYGRRLDQRNPAA